MTNITLRLTWIYTYGTLINRIKFSLVQVLMMPTLKCIKGDPILKRSLFSWLRTTEFHSINHIFNGRSHLWMRVGATVGMTCTCAYTRTFAYVSWLLSEIVLIAKSEVDIYMRQKRFFFCRQFFYATIINIIVVTRWRLIFAVSDNYWIMTSCVMFYRFGQSFRTSVGLR